MMTQQSSSPSRDLDQAKSDIHDAIENGRELVRQSRLLLELAEAESPAIADNDND